MQSAVELTRTITDLHIRPLRDSDVLRICSWVTCETELRMVSGDVGERLTRAILQSWVANAAASLVVVEVKTQEVIGFCTLSKRELRSLPPDYIELCHLLVDPQKKYVFNGSRLINFAKSWARSLGYKFGCARVIPYNQWSLILARYEKAEEFTDKELWVPAGFRWFRVDLRRPLAETVRYAQ